MKLGTPLSPSAVRVMLLGAGELGGGSRGPVTEKLQSKYFDVVHGRHHMHPEWLSYVND